MSQNDLFLSPRPSNPDVRPTLKPELGQWFTPAWAAEILAADALAGLGRVGVVEPSCGDGAFLAAIPDRHDTVGIEIDPRMAETARLATGRPVIVGDFATAEIAIDNLGLVVGNPPYSIPIIDSFIMRSKELLPEDGICALLLPAHVLSTTARVARWNRYFAIEPRIVPRSLFPRISLPLVWTRFTRSDVHSKRTMVGLMLFEEQSAVETMPKAVRRALGRPGTWREAVGLVLHSLGGEATLQEVYRAIEPRRPTANRFWADKVRQTLGLYFERVGDPSEHRFSLPKVQ